MKPQLQTLKGFRDFLPTQKRQREFVAQKIKTSFELFGFEPLETPTLEYASLLLGKYGNEADKLVYQFEDNGSRQVALRYDQTVPTARVLSQYQNELPRQFRRYQMQNVFRADKPQKGRFREFAQCDIDIFGSTSSIADAEILACTFAAYRAIGFTEVELRVNDRETLLATLQPFATDKVSVLSIVQSIDKLDKLPADTVLAELVTKGLSPTNAQTALTELEQAQQSANLTAILDAAQQLGVPRSALKFTPQLARGLDYYTGMIFEVLIPQYSGGSCGGGGRYDNLIQTLGGPAMPAVGMAFGFDRTVEAALELNLLPTSLSATQVLVTIFNSELSAAALKTAHLLRQAGINTELYPAPDKLAKQLKLADQKNIPMVIVIGDDEAATNQIMVKDMATGTQQQTTVSDLLATLQK